MGHEKCVKNFSPKTWRA